MIYFTSDLHLGHANIIASCNRPFSDVEEMDRTIIGNWNSRVTDRDDVYVLGDVSYRNRTDVGSMLAKLKGHKHLIVGNHDHIWMRTCDPGKYFETFSQMHCIMLDGRKIFMCHYPLMEWEGSFYGSYLVFGHIHNATGQPFWPLIVGNDHMLNAGVDVNGFYPVTFEEMRENNRYFKRCWQ